jgi:hypothetical protein
MCYHAYDSFVCYHKLVIYESAIVTLQVKTAWVTWSRSYVIYTLCKAELGQEDENFSANARVCARRIRQKSQEGFAYESWHILRRIPNHKRKIKCWEREWNRDERERGGRERREGRRERERREGRRERGKIGRWKRAGQFLLARGYFGVLLCCNNSPFTANLQMHHNTTKHTKQTEHRKHDTICWDDDGVLISASREDRLLGHHLSLANQSKIYQGDIISLIRICLYCIFVLKPWSREHGVVAKDFVCTSDLNKYILYD